MFLVGWGYAIAQYGFFLGVGLGWVPAALIAAIAGFLWPLLAFLLAIGVLVIGGFMMWQITHP